MKGSDTVSDNVKQLPYWDRPVGTPFRGPGGVLLKALACVEGCRGCVYKGTCHGSMDAVVPCTGDVRSDRRAVIFVAVENEIPIKPGGHDTPIGEKFRDEARPDVVLEVVGGGSCQGCVYHYAASGCPPETKHGLCTSGQRRDGTSVCFREVPQPTPKDEPQPDTGYPTREEIIAKVRELRPRVRDCVDISSHDAIRLSGMKEVCDAILAFAEPPDMTFGEAVAAICVRGGAAFRRGKLNVRVSHGADVGRIITEQLEESDTSAVDWCLVRPIENSNP